MSVARYASASILPSRTWAYVVRCVKSLAMGSPFTSTYLGLGARTTLCAFRTSSTNFPLPVPD